MPAGSTWSDRDDAVMRALHAMGDGPVEIADWLGFHTCTLKRKMHEAGLAPKHPRVKWTIDMDRMLRLNYPRFPAFLIGYVLGLTESSVQNRAHKLKLEKANDFWTQPNARLWCDFDHPDKVANRFKRGAVPPNKGKRRPGWAPGRMAETQFKKGTMNGAAQHNYVPIGTEKIDTKRNVLMRKTTDDPTIFPVKRWRPVHVLVWEAANGPVPKGHMCVFRPGTKTFVADEITTDKLEVITLVENMRRNTIHNWPADIKRAMYMSIALKRSITLKEKRGNQRG